jgi:hypothetical protein
MWMEKQYQSVGLKQNLIKEKSSKTNPAQFSRSRTPSHPAIGRFGNIFLGCARQGLNDMASLWLKKTSLVRVVRMALNNV